MAAPSSTLESIFMRRVAYEHYRELLNCLLACQKTPATPEDSRSNAEGDVQRACLIRTPGTALGAALAIVSSTIL